MVVVGKEAEKKAKAYDVDAERTNAERWVTMTNALTRAGHGLTLSEKRIVCCAIAKLDSRKPIQPGELPKTRIYASEYAETFGVDMDTAYDQLQSAARLLMTRSITFFAPSYKRNGKELKTTRTTMQWVGQVDYAEGEGWIELYWWPNLLPHLTGLRKNFTSYQLGQASDLRSIYSWRVLEMLTRFESTGWLEVNIDDFATSMDATEKQRADFAKLRTKIIEPAIAELTQKDGWVIEWEPIKKGRKVEALRFVFERNPRH